MLTRVLLLLALLPGCEFGCCFEAGQRSEAQAVGTGSLSRVVALDGGLCAGTGTVGDPFHCDLVTGTGVTGTGSAGSPLSVSASGGSAIVTFGLMGDGSDGTFVFDGTTPFVDRRGVVHAPVSNVYTQTNDIFCNSCTVNVGVSVRTAGFRFYDRGTLTLNGKIERNGNDASGVTGGATTTVGNTYFNEGGAAGGNGGAGAAAACATGGATSDNVASSGAPGLSCENTGGGVGAVGGKCHGGGGGNGGDGTACAGGAANIQNVASSGANFRMFWDALMGRINYTGSGTARTYPGGSGGGGGRGGSSPTVYGGGGGGGGGVVHVYAAQFAGSGSVEAKGGNGANGQAGGNSGGGGGGGGGVAVVVVASGGCPTINVSGGVGGLGNGTGSNGGNGGAGVYRCFQMR